VNAVIVGAGDADDAAAELVTFLCARGSDAITGQAIAVGARGA